MAMMKTSQVRRRCLGRAVLHSIVRKGISVNKSFANRPEWRKQSTLSAKALGHQLMSQREDRILRRIQRENRTPPPTTRQREGHGTDCGLHCGRNGKPSEGCEQGRASTQLLHFKYHSAALNKGRSVYLRGSRGFYRINHGCGTNDGRGSNGHSQALSNGRTHWIHW